MTIRDLGEFDEYSNLTEEIETCMQKRRRLSSSLRLPRRSSIVSLRSKVHERGESSVRSKIRNDFLEIGVLLGSPLLVSN